MAKTVLTNPKVWFGGYDITTALSAIALRSGVDPKDSTTFGATQRVYSPGLKLVDSQYEGFVDLGAGLTEEALQTALGAAATPMSVSPIGGGSTGNLVYFFNANEASLQQGAPVGEMYRFSLAAATAGTLEDGIILHGRAVETATAVGVEYQLGAVAAGVTVWAALHVFAVTGTNPTLDVIIESDAASGPGMATPITRATFAQATAISGQMVSFTGAVTDTWWRTSWTIGGTGSPSFDFAVVLGLRL